MQQAVAAAVERFGGLDIVVANAGIASKGATFRAMSTESFDRVIDVNLMGVVRTVEAALPQIVERKGHVVVIASIYAFINGLGTTPVRDEQGRASSSSAARCGSSWSSTARAPASPTSASSTPRWCTG